MKDKDGGMIPGAPPRIVSAAPAGVVSLENLRPVPTIEIHGFKVGIVADVRRPAALGVLAEDGTVLDRCEIPAGAMVAIIVPETAQKLRFGIPAAARAFIKVI